MSEVLSELNFASDEPEIVAAPVPSTFANVRTPVLRVPSVSRTDAASIALLNEISTCAALIA